MLDSCIVDQNVDLGTKWLSVVIVGIIPFNIINGSSHCSHDLEWVAEVALECEAARFVR